MLSNSLFLEEKGWGGIAFDPLSIMEGRWRQERKAAFHRVAIGSQRRDVEFVEIIPKDGWENALSGFREFVRQEDVQMYGSREYLVRTAPLGDFVEEDQGIDVIMIDVEGAESVVLDGIDFELLGPTHMIIENISRIGGGESIRELLTARGYTLVARIGGSDDIFTRRPVNSHGSRTPSSQRA